MRAVMSLGLLLALATAPTASYAMRAGGGHGVRVHIQHIQHHGLHHFRTMRRTPFVGEAFGDGFYGSDLAPYGAYGETAAPEPIAVPSALPLRRVGDDRPTVEHTDVGVTIIRGPGLSHLAP